MEFNLPLAETYKLYQNFLFVAKSRPPIVVQSPSADHHHHHFHNYQGQNINAFNLGPWRHESVSMIKVDFA